MITTNKGVISGGHALTFILAVSVSINIYMHNLCDKFVSRLKLLYISLMFAVRTVLEALPTSISNIWCYMPVTC